MGEVDLTEKIGGDFVSRWLSGPPLIEVCAFYPFTDKERALSKAENRTSPQQAGPPSLLQALSKVVLSAYWAESANWARRRMSPGSQNPRGPRAPPDVRSKQQELSRGWE